MNRTTCHQIMERCNRSQAFMRAPMGTRVETTIACRARSLSKYPPTPVSFWHYGPGNAWLRLACGTPDFYRQVDYGRDVIFIMSSSGWNSQN